MALDGKGAKHLNLLRTSPTFVLFERDDGQFRVANPDTVGPDQGAVWMAATLTLSSGNTLPSVVKIETSSGLPEQALFAWHNNQWFEPANPEDRPEFMASLSATEQDVFPYRWDTHVPLSLS